MSARNASRQRVGEAAAGSSTRSISAAETTFIGEICMGAGQRIVDEVRAGAEPDAPVPARSRSSSARWRAASRALSAGGLAVAALREPHGRAAEHHADGGRGEDDDEERHGDAGAHAEPVERIERRPRRLCGWRRRTMSPVPRSATARSAFRKLFIANSCRAPRRGAGRVQAGLGPCSAGCAFPCRP